MGDLGEIISLDSVDPNSDADLHSIMGPGFASQPSTVSPFNTRRYTNGISILRPICR